VAAAAARGVRALLAARGPLAAARGVRALPAMGMWPPLRPVGGARCRGAGGASAGAALTGFGVWMNMSFA